MVTHVKTALLLFHARTGARVTIRSLAPLFSALAAMIILNNAPGAVVRFIAKEVFKIPKLGGAAAVFAVLAFLLPTWGVRRLALGLNQWFRHLPLSSDDNRRGLALGLAVIQSPLVLALLLLGVVSHPASPTPLLRWAVIFAAGVTAALPVRGERYVRPCALVAAALAFSQPWWTLAPAAALLWLADRIAGPIRELPPRKPWRITARLVLPMIAWRALGLKSVTALLPGLAAIAVGWLYAVNNSVDAGRAAAAARFGGTLACTLTLASLAGKLATQRPPWPWARSLPWSSARRVLLDAAFLGAHALPLVIVTVWQGWLAGLAVACALPFLALRAAEHMRRLPGRSSGMQLFTLEGFLGATLLALVPATAILYLAAIAPALYLARQSESRLKVMRWIETLNSETRA